MIKNLLFVVLLATLSCAEPDNVDTRFHNSSEAAVFLEQYNEAIWEVNESNTLGILGVMFSETPQKATVAMGSFDIDNNPVVNECEILFFGASDFGESANVIQGDKNSITILSWDEEKNTSSVKLVIRISENTLTMAVESVFGKSTIYMTRNDTKTAASFCN